MKVSLDGPKFDDDLFAYDSGHKIIALGRYSWHHLAASIHYSTFPHLIFVHRTRDKAFFVALFYPLVNKEKQGFTFPVIQLVLTRLVK